MELVLINGTLVFLGKDVWCNVLRILKPGSFCLAFCSPKLYHKTAYNLEEAGFNIIDQIMWITTTKMIRSNGLKPCHEPIVVAQKSKTENSIDDNVLKWGTGKINIDNARIPWSGEIPKNWAAGGHQRRFFGKEHSSEIDYKEYGKLEANVNGRYPSNIIGSVLPKHQEYFYDPIIDDEDAYDNYYFAGRVTAKERAGNIHPTPKPIRLMRYLIRLYTPKKGIVIDPFSGSGSTGVAALQEDMSYIGIEIEQEYNNIAKKRLEKNVNKINIEKLFLYE
jgi:DNA modification methylase